MVPFALRGLAAVSRRPPVIIAWLPKRKSFYLVKGFDATLRAA